MKPTIITEPSPLGLRPTFGFGDRIGLATPGHVAALGKSRFLPVFAQQSIREMERTQRTPEEVISAARTGVEKAQWTAVWGADADHLKTEEDVRRTADAGFTMFTIDPSAYVEPSADGMQLEELEPRLNAVMDEAGLGSITELEDRYLRQTWNLSPELALRFDDRLLLLRAAFKYGRALSHADRMARCIQNACGDRAFEIELSVDETDTPTSPLEHLFIGLELRRRGVKLISLAPRYTGEFEKGVDFIGDIDRFEKNLIQHAAIARYCGPYKLGVHSGSDKFMVYPLFAKHCEGMIHVKTAGTSYLEALRVVSIADHALFLEIVQYALSRFEEDRASYHISARLSQAPDPASLSPGELEIEFLDHFAGRQIMHVTFGSVLSQGRTVEGRTMKEAIREVLEANARLHSELLERHLSRHLQLLET